MIHGNHKVKKIAPVNFVDKDKSKEPDVISDEEFLQLLDYLLLSNSEYAKTFNNTVKEFSADSSDVEIRVGNYIAELDGEVISYLAVRMGQVICPTGHRFHPTGGKPCFHCRAVV